MTLDTVFIKSIANTEDSFYLYNENGIITQAQTLKAHFPSARFLYSVKCNPNMQVVRCIAEQGFGADAASLNEVKLARKVGLLKNQIYYSAPGKSMNDLEEALDESVIIADSIGEIRRIDELAKKREEVISIGVRINPSFSFAGEKGGWSKFGIDQAQLFEFLKSGECRNVTIEGIHLHLKSQELKAELLEQYYRNIFELAESMEKEFGLLFKFINMGSGIGVPYAAYDEPMDLERLGAFTEAAIAEYKAKHPHTKVLIETGRFLVCENGIYVTKVLDRKESCGKVILICSNTMNGFIRPSIARMVEGYAGIGVIAAKEPLYTSRDAFTFVGIKTAEGEETDEEETVTIMGNLCTAADVMAENICMKKLDVGDLIVVNHAGAYARVLSPMQFSSQKEPKEFVVRE